MIKVRFFLNRRLVKQPGVHPNGIRRPGASQQYH